MRSGEAATSDVPGPQPTVPVRPAATGTPADPDGSAAKAAARGGLAVRRRRLRRFVPPQHGAWAMLLVPYLAGLLVGGGDWLDVPLLVAWLAAYLLSYHLFQAIKTGRPGRFRDQLLAEAAIALPFGTLVVATRPRLLVFAPIFAALVAVNLWYAWRRRERALLNDFASVLQSCLIVLVVASVAGTPLRDAAGAFAACLAYFAGTVFHVKSMIRERGNPTFRWYSVAYHTAALVLAVRFGWWLVAVFAWLLVRAWAIPRRQLTPKTIGILEVVNCLLLLAGIALTWA